MAHLTENHVQELYKTFGELKVLDDIIRHRAADSPPAPIFGYPRNENLNDYEKFTGKQINQFIDSAVKNFLRLGLKPNTREVVGLFAQSNVDYLVTLFALSRMGYTVLCLSLRLAPVAIVNLLKQTDCNIIVHGQTPQIETTIAAVNEQRPLRTVPIPSRSQYEVPANEEPFVREYDPDKETFETAIILHSSGSTGLPKPIAISHQSLMTHPVQGAGMNNFAVLPLYHVYGLSTTLQAMYMRKTANLFSSTMPMTTENLVTATGAVNPEVIHVVPYSLGLLAEQPRGLEILRSAKIVTAAGSRTPDELGDRLVREGVNFGVVFGTTEAGLLGDTMRRSAGDDSWDYVRIYANVRKYVQMDPLGDNQFEAVYLRGHPGLFNIDSDSWRSRDVFVPHPSLPDVWKYVTRLDDRVTLSNGEKVLPLPIEGCIRQHELVREAVVAGIDKPLPGVLLFRTESSDDLSDEAYLEAVWPTIVEANSRAEAFSQITKDMVYILGSDVQYPRTDKGIVIRAQVYKHFAAEIEEMYTRLDDGAEGTLRYGIEGLEGFIKGLYEDIMGTTLDSVDTDFFTAGIDSLNAIQMRRRIQKTLYLGGQKLSNNVVYERGNVRSLARHLYSLAQGAEDEDEDREPLMHELIDKYSKFGETVVLTGATGSLGAHTLAQMVASPDIRKIYCLVRGSDPMGRVNAALKERDLKLEAPSKVVALSADFSRADFGLSKEIYEQFRVEVSIIVHLAWPVNFNIHLPSFELHLAGLNNLLALSLSVHHSEPARLYFASSVSAAENTPAPALIPEAPIEDFSQATRMGYAQSKLVGEYMVLNAARIGARAYVIRTGQVVGDKENGHWNEAEFIPSLIRSALSLKALPILHEDVSWLPVDTLATSLLELDQTLRAAPRPCAIDPITPPVFYNMVNPALFRWEDLLVSLKEAGLDFEAVPFEQWLQMLRDDDARGNEKQNPAVKLVGYFEQRYGGGSAGSIVFDTKVIQRDSAVMRKPPQILKDGYVKKFLDRWQRRWSPATAA
ncbi:acetyl-CoA synthetase-like protein [Hypoxylon cercidicola]|nr:acetyl-CoA synthetase-like protein [Hypoxylon cercidicola]